MASREGAEAARLLEKSKPQEKRTAAARKQRRLWAKTSADLALRNMARHVESLAKERDDLKQELEQLCGNADIAERIEAVLPVLEAQLDGKQPSFVQKLRRNVALHAAATGICIPKASLKQLRGAQKGPRLEQRTPVTEMQVEPLRATAQPFAPGVWWTNHSEDPENLVAQAVERAYSNVTAILAMLQDEDADVDDAEHAFFDCVGIPDDYFAPEEEAEELEDVPAEEKQGDPWMGAKLRRTVDGTELDAVVDDIERGKVTGERLYRIRYADGDAEHLTALQCRECCLPDHLQARLDAADKDADATVAQ